MIPFQFLLKIFHFPKFAVRCSEAANSILFYYQISEEWTQ